MISDQIGDMLIRIKNAKLGRLLSCNTFFSKEKEAIVKILHQQGFIDQFEIKENEKINQKTININLKYKNKICALTDLKRISKPGLRIYKKASHLPLVLNGLGVAIVSTSRGIMTARDARKIKQGGEVIAYIW